MNKHLEITSPWGNLIGLAKTLIYLSIAGTLFFTPASVLATPMLGMEPQYGCSGVRSVLLFCLFETNDLAMVKNAAAIFMLVAASGIYPAIFALPAAYVAHSVSLSTSLPDGGDQIAASMLTILLAYGVLDWRKTHWDIFEPTETPRWLRSRVAISSVSLLLTRIQISVVYFFAGVEKLSADAWLDGSAIYAWTRHISFGAPEWLSPIAYYLTSLPAVTAGITWATVVLEIALGISLLLPLKIRVRYLLPAGLLLHLGIIFLLGIASFSLIMFGALLILLLPPGAAVTFRPNNGEPPLEEREPMNKPEKVLIK